MSGLGLSSTAAWRSALSRRTPIHILRFCRALIKLFHLKAIPDTEAGVLDPLGESVIGGTDTYLAGAGERENSLHIHNHISLGER